MGCPATLAERRVMTLKGPATSTAGMARPDRGGGR